MSKDDRLFAPFPIEMDEHPKIIGLSDAAFRALIEGTFYSRRMLSDGFLDERVVLRRWGQDVADELSANDPERPSWVRVERGWRIHDFEKHHPLRAEIEAKRASVSAKRSQAGAKGAAKRWQTDSKSDGKSMASHSSETETETETSSGRAKRAHPLPADWSPTDKHRNLALERGVDLVREVEQFRAHAAANGRTQKDWDASFRLWLGNAKPMRVQGDPFARPPVSAPSTPSPGSAADQGYCRHWNVLGDCGACEKEES